MPPPINFTRPSNCFTPINADQTASKAQSPAASATQGTAASVAQRPVASATQRPAASPVTIPSIEVERPVNPSLQAFRDVLDFERDANKISREAVAKQLNQSGLKPKASRGSLGEIYFNTQSLKEPLIEALQKAFPENLYVKALREIPLSECYGKRKGRNLGTNKEGSPAFEIRKILDISAEHWLGEEAEEWEKAMEVNRTMVRSDPRKSAKVHQAWLSSRTRKTPRDCFINPPDVKFIKNLDIVRAAAEAKKVDLDKLQPHTKLQKVEAKRRYDEDWDRKTNTRIPRAEDAFPVDENPSSSKRRRVDQRGESPLGNETVAGPSRMSSESIEDNIMVGTQSPRRPSVAAEPSAPLPLPSSPSAAMEALNHLSFIAAAAIEFAEGPKKG